MQTSLESTLTSLALVLTSAVSLVVSVLSLPYQLFRESTFRRVPKAILITGASSGIGEALALKYAKKGVFLALTGRNKERTQAVAKACRELGAEVEVGIVDVTDRIGLEEFILKVDNKRPLDLVVANAGVSGAMLGEKPFDEKILEMFDVNVLGAFRTVHPLVERFKLREKGQIAVVASLSGLYDFPRSVAYSSSKACLITYCRGLRGALRPHNIGVTAICPGYVQTEFTKHSHAQGRNTPFLMDSTRAASIIVDGLERDKPVIAFPTQMFILTFVLRALPPGAHETLMDLFGLQKKIISWNRLG